jgi:3'-5' exoribonuclease
MGKTFVTDLIEGESVTSFFLLKQVQVRQRRSGEPFLSMVLGDRTGEMAAVMWEGVEEAGKELAEGDVVKVQGLLGTYQRARQLTITRLRKAAPEEVVAEDYLPRTLQEPTALLAHLRATVDAMQEPYLQRLLHDLLADEDFMADFTVAPAAKNIHHAVLGGLLEHTASVVGLCRVLAEYYPAVDRDLLLAAAMLHDVGKVRELTWDRVFDYSDAGRLLGHITLGALLVEARIREISDFPETLAQRLLHCILSHHGELEWGSPRRPKTLEALVLHYAEDLDGKVNAFLGFAQQHPDPQHPGWTQFNKALDRYLYFGRGEIPDPPSER